VWVKVREEMQELQEAKDPDHVEQEFGDLMFALINLSRYLKIDPENALERTNKKFISRFSYIEEQAAGMQKNLRDMSLAEMDALWDKAKAKEREA
ncbi:MAG TPA: MazG nucleotide pyrophosphohydrolase domain-containing protein, partial [Chitinophagales bacterium]|nr:MazG nucleotide pyrophosphohydrolase domain-containing protein [Chitinophagales bacterium]